MFLKLQNIILCLFCYICNPSGKSNYFFADFMCFFEGPGCVVGPYSPPDVRFSCHWHKAPKNLTFFLLIPKVTHTPPTNKGGGEVQEFLLAFDSGAAPSLLSRHTVSSGPSRPGPETRLPRGAPHRRAAHITAGPPRRGPAAAVQDQALGLELPHPPPEPGGVCHPPPDCRIFACGQPTQIAH